MTTRIYSYNPHSASAKALSGALGIKRIKHRNSKYRPKREDVIINWGSSSLPMDIERCNRDIINDPLDIAVVTNKLSFFQTIGQKDLNDLVVPWSPLKSDAVDWVNQGKTVVARTKLTGHSGEGIVLLEGVDAEIIDAPLYTLYVPKKDEYRVHVVKKNDGPAVFDVQRKARKLDVPDEEVDWRVRNLNGGFIYQRQGVDVPDVVNDVALKVFEQTGLDFGAVDILYNEKDSRAYALEVNTAPGLTGTTLDKYVEMFKELL